MGGGFEESDDEPISKPRAARKGPSTFDGSTVSVYETPIGCVLALLPFLQPLKGLRGFRAGHGYGNLQETFSWIASKNGVGITMDV